MVTFNDVTTSAMFASDATQSRAYIDRLNAYLCHHVDDGNSLVCRYGALCRASARRAFGYGEGQLPHVGLNYAMTRNGRPWRIVIAGMEVGEASETGNPAAEHETMETRRQVIVRNGQKRFGERNPHMGGVISTLRIWFERDPGTDHAGEYVKLQDGSIMHVYAGFALVNFLMCSAVDNPATSRKRKSLATPMMKQNCGGHFREIIDILDPTIIVSHGFPNDGAARALEGDPRLVPLVHPSCGRPGGWWGRSPQSAYLLDEARPAIERKMRAIARRG